MNKSPIQGPWLRQTLQIFSQNHMLYGPNFNFAKWLKRHHSFLPENSYAAAFIRAGRYINADEQDLVYVDVAISVGSIARPRILRKIYSTDEPALLQELGRLVQVPEEYENDIDTIIATLNDTQLLGVDVEVRLYEDEDFIVPYAVIESIYPAGELYTDYSDE